MTLSESIEKFNRIEKGVKELLKGCDNRFDAYIILNCASLAIEFGTLTFKEINYSPEFYTSIAANGFCNSCHYEGNNFIITPSRKFAKCPKCGKRRNIENFRVLRKEDRDCL